MPVRSVLPGTIGTAHKGACGPNIGPSGGQDTHTHIGTRVVSSLNDLMENLTVVLFKFNCKKEPPHLSEGIVLGGVDDGSVAGD